MSDGVGELPPPARMMQLISGKWITQSLGVVAELKIADRVGDGARSADELAEETGSNPDALYRLLRALTVVGVFHEGEGRKFALTEIGQTLRSDVPVSLCAMARFMAHEATWKPWGELRHSVRTGEPSFPEVHGCPAFEYLVKFPEAAPVFNEAMTSMSSLEIFPIVASYDFSGVGTVVDVGGGHGALLAGILGQNPDVRGVLYEMPHATEGAKKLFAERGLANRVEVVAGDFFSKVPEGGDVYLMKHIIHDWADERAVQIMSNCRAAMKQGGRLLLAEMIVPPANVPDFSKLLDLEMLVVSPGGRERSEAEFADLYQRAGLRFERVIRTPAPIALLEGARPS